MIAIATVVHTLFYLSYTFKLFNKVTRTSWGPIALAMKPNVFTVALLIPFLCAFSRSNKSKHILIHSLGLTYSLPLSAILPTKSIVFSYTFSCLFLRIGVSLGNRSFIGGVILVIPITLTIALRAANRLPNTSGYSSPRHSYSNTPSLPSRASSLHSFIEKAILQIKSAACCLTLLLLLFSLHWIIPQI